MALSCGLSSINASLTSLGMKPQRPEVCRLRSRWRSPNAAVTQDFHLPMHSFEIKNRTSVDDIKCLRLITAIKTPYLPDGRFDLEAYDALMNMQIANGAEGVIVGGTTGEGQLMTWDEHIMLIGHTVNCFGTKIKVIGNVGSNSTREAIHATEQGFAVGMHAALHINPYYGKTSMQGLFLHFQSVLSMGPTIIYNVPSRTGQDIPPSVIQEIMPNPNFAGVKECMGNERIKGYADKGIMIWSGNDDQCHDSRWGFGAAGVISVASNLVPGLMHSLMFGGLNPSLNSKLMPLFEWLFREPNPIGLNTALAQLGVVRPIFRLPYFPLPLESREEFVRIVKDIGREHFVGEKDVRVLEDDEFSLLSRY
ncbi:4-hydroxy-tetrahydrodipicolinate synthase, chloroplastic-like [Asparagus officinalis]|uniref:4-hydroxy-tetrahydrodipicolinate synthase, chloroplastic-like n=1 Tax=Asparagus officinalis TaxID=4686 RepID=UPI00098E706A|nr:4-hydroxy-tetrahydrodipicolinate synthase, chloroplastic-like [Asparagus officinalis]